MTRPVIQMDTEVTTQLWLPNIFALFVQKVEKPEFIVPAAGVHLYQDKLIFRVGWTPLHFQLNAVCPSGSVMQIYP